MKKKPIGVFDSGVGGLTVVRELINHLPQEDIVYFGDTARFPYGTKSPEELRLYVTEIINFLLKEGVKLVIVACNSASSAALEHAQINFSIPVMGVIEPGARAAAQVSVNRKVGVIGTMVTIESQAYEKAVHAFDAGIQVFSQACPSFAGLVENGEIQSVNTKGVVRDYLEPLMEAEVDALILGCTHYPLLIEPIKKVVGDNVVLISSAKEVAQEAEEVIARRGHLNQGLETPAYRFVSTGDRSKFLKLGKRFLGREIKQVEEVSLSELKLKGT